MLAARQAATAQLELFRAEMAAESAKMRAVVERQVIPMLLPVSADTSCRRKTGSSCAHALINQWGKDKLSDSWQQVEVAMLSSQAQHADQIKHDNLCRAAHHYKA